MPPRPRPPAGVMHVVLEVEDNGESATFGFWLNWSPTAPRDAASAEDIVTSWVVNVQQYFLNCMHSGASFRTCRLAVVGGTPFTWEALLAPNAGAGSGGVTLARAVGLYLQGASGGRGSGTRIRIPGISQQMVDPPGKLSTYGVQQLQFAADALAGWPAQLLALGVGVPELVTLQTKDNGTLLNPPQIDLTLVVRPSLVLELAVRRARSFNRLSPS